MSSESVGKTRRGNHTLNGMWRSISLWSIYLYFRRKGKNVLELMVDKSFTDTGTYNSDKQKTEVIQYLYTKGLLE